MRSSIPPAQLLKQVKAAIGTANSGQAVFGVQTMSEFISDSVAEPRFNVFLIGAFALVAVAMAAAGMYSVVSLGLFFLLVTLIAAYAPVRRACRVNPAMALRCE